MPSKFKKCPECGVEKEHSAFSYNKGTYDNLCAYCKVCRSVRRKKQYKSRLVGKYGITIQQYNEMLISQNGQCAICGSTDPAGRGSNFHIDHCHDSNTVRGLLCANCNTAIGLFRESTEHLSSAIQYLGKFKHLKAKVLEFNPSQGLQ